MTVTCVCADDVRDGQRHDRCRLKEVSKVGPINWSMAAIHSGRVVRFRLFTACSKRKVRACVSQMH